MRYLDLLHDVIDTFGKEQQMVVVVEELSELQKEVCKILRGGGHLEHIAEEMADVQICLDQLECIFGNHSKVAEWQRMKTQRLAQLLEEEKAKKCQKAK